MFHEVPDTWGCAIRTATRLTVYRLLNPTCNDVAAPLSAASHGVPTDTLVCNLVCNSALAGMRRYCCTTKRFRNVHSSLKTLHALP